MRDFYELQQFLKTFGIVIYMKDRLHTLNLVEYEVRELYKTGLMEQKDYIRAIAIIRREASLEISEVAV